MLDGLMYDLLYVAFNSKLCRCVMSNLGLLREKPSY